jgi:hypothetical protein
MNNFKLIIKPKSLSKTKNGTYPYLVSGPQKFLDFYRDNMEGVITDDKSGQLMFFHKKLFAFGGEILYFEDREYPFSGQPNIQSALALESMSGFMAELNKSVQSDETEDEDSDSAELEKPTSKPKGVVKKIGKK